MTDFADIIAPDLDGPPDDPAWAVADVSSAEWAMAKLAALQTEMRAVEEQAYAWTRQISRWTEGELNRLEQSASFFRSHLESYALDQRLADDRKRTIRLPSGEIRTTRRAPRVAVGDEEAFVAWAKESDPDLLRVKYTPLVSVIRERTDIAEGTLQDVVATATGERVPGLIVEPESLTAKVMIATEKEQLDEDK